jgi:hypothetical protein
MKKLSPIESTSSTMDTVINYNNTYNMKDNSNVNNYINSNGESQ